MTKQAPGRVFGLTEWTEWLDRLARALWGISGPEFERAYAAGDFSDSGPARDLGSFLPLLAKLRSQTE